MADRNKHVCSAKPVVHMMATLFDSSKFRRSRKQRKNKSLDFISDLDLQQKQRKIPSQAALHYLHQNCIPKESLKLSFKIELKLHCFRNQHLFSNVQ